MSNNLNAFVAHRYLNNLFVWIAFFMSLVLIFIWTIDPYGVSPLRIRVPGINTYKPKRLAIDRLIKPYEVWRYQPKTIFMGTSRIHQSMDPTVFDHTEFGPAYNASIPASSLAENAAYLEKYFQIDGNLKNVFVEMFIYNFIVSQPEKIRKSFAEILKNTAALLFSTDALYDALQTITLNKPGIFFGAYITPRGNWIKPKNFDTNETFNSQLFISNIMNIHKKIPDMTIQPSAIQTLDRIAALCKKHHAKLYLVITPGYPWDDYRLLSLGYWPLLEEWIRKLSIYENVMSFSQYNAILEELPGAEMKYWNDPLHFNAKMGTLMLKSFLGSNDPEIPINLYRPVTIDNIELVLQERLNGLHHWIARNHKFTESFDHAKKLAGNTGHPRERN